MLTQSHPWGYKRNDPAAILSVHQIREALDTFREASPMYKEQRPSQIPLTATWPYDANAPIPLALLISEILANDTPSGCKAKLLERLKHLPFWQETGPDWHKKQQAKVMEAMTQEGSPLADRLDHLIARLKCVLTDKGHYGVPVLIVPQVTRSIGEIPSHEKPAEEAKPDPIETFFVRINCGFRRT